MSPLLVVSAHPAGLPLLEVWDKDQPLAVASLHPLRLDCGVMELRGPRVTLRTPRLDDADRLFQWFADPEVTRFLPLAGQEHLPMEVIRSFLQRVSVSDRPELAVSLDVNGEHVGCGGLRGIDVESAELSIVVGERRFRECGIASEAITPLLNHAFDVIGLNTGWLVVRADNVRAVHLFEHFRFVRTEIRSAAVVVAGEPKDKWKMVLDGQHFDARLSDVRCPG